VTRRAGVSPLQKLEFPVIFSRLAQRGHAEGEYALSMLSESELDPKINWLEN